MICNTLDVKLSAVGFNKINFYKYIYIYIYIEEQ